MQKSQQKAAGAIGEFQLDLEKAQSVSKESTRMGIRHNFRIAVNRGKSWQTSTLQPPTVDRSSIRVSRSKHHQKLHHEARRLEHESTFDVKVH
ncbi:hypothetical protein R1flu_002652 [Riccia fluitans]|uniref:Uncharacterized protein n=1 Tax=Riccia fluitans TaxID=41844 RepID=A0ABD1Y9P6_9MARC